MFRFFFCSTLGITDFVIEITQLCYLLHCLISCSISWWLNDARNSDNIRFCYNVHLLTFYQWWNRRNYSQYRLNLYFQLKLAKFTRFLGERQKLLSLRRESKLGRWHISLVVHEKVKKLVLYPWSSSFSLLFCFMMIT